MSAALDWAEAFERAWRLVVEARDYWHLEPGHQPPPESWGRYPAAAVSPTGQATPVPPRPQ